MKVLQVNCVYKTGSTGKIVYDIHSVLLAKGIESVVCYGRGAKTTDHNVYKTCSELYSKFNNLMSRIRGIMYGGLFFSTKKLISVIKKENPDVVHLHCINGYFVNIYKIISFLKNSGIKTVLTLHAEFMHTANCGYAIDCEKWKSGCGNCPRFKRETGSLIFDRTHKSWLKMKEAFDGFDNLVVTSVSPWLMERAKQSPILADKKHVVVLNGLDTTVFKVYDTQDLRDKHGVNGERVVFHATPSFNNDPNHIKGGYYILKLAEMLKDQNIKFIVAGSYDESIEIPDNMIMLGRVNDQRELARYYSMADATVIASQRETFSMIVAESLSCGTPIVGFKAGAPEQITIPEYSSFVEYGNVEKFKDALDSILKRDYEKTEISGNAHLKYSKEKMLEGYLKEYNN